MLIILSISMIPMATRLVMRCSMSWGGAWCPHSQESLTLSQDIEGRNFAFSFITRGMNWANGWESGCYRQSGMKNFIIRIAGFLLPFLSESPKSALEKRRHRGLHVQIGLCIEPKKVVGINCAWLLRRQKAFRNAKKKTPVWG